MARTVDLAIRYVTDFVDRGAQGLLKQDRAVRRSLDQTDKALEQQAKAARRAGEQISRAGTQASRAQQRAAQASRHSASGSRASASASRAVADAYGQATRQALRSVQAHRQAATAAKRSAAEQKAAAAAMNGAAVGAGTAGAAGRLGGAGLAAGAAAGIGAGSAVQAFVGFEKQMDRVQAVAGATGAQIAAMNAQAKQLGADTAFSAKEAADGMYQLSTAGFTANQTMKILPGTLALASASGTDLAASAELQAAAIRGFGLTAGDATRVADTLAKTVNSSAVEMSDLGETLPYVASTARQTGTSFEQVAAAAGILGNAGIKGSMAGTALRTSMLRLTDPSVKMGNVLREIGIGSHDLAAQPLPEVIGRIAEGLKKLPTRGEKVGVISAIFGKEAAPAMLNLMSEGRAGIDKLVEGLKNSEGAAQSAANIMRGNVSGAWDEFTGSVETASITLVEKFGPAMSRALKAGAGAVNAVPRVAQAVAVGASGGSPGPDAGTAERVGTKVGQMAASVGTAAVSAGRQLLDAFKPALPFFQNVLLPLLKGVGQGVLVGIVGAFKVAVPVIRGVATVFGVVGQAAAPFRGVIEGVGTAIGFVFGGVLLRGIAMLGKLGGVFRVVGAAASVLALPIRLVGAAFGFITRGVAKVPGALGKLGGIFARAGDAAARLPATIAGFAGRIAKAAGRLVTSAARGLAGLAGRMTSAASRAGAAVVGRVAGFAGRMTGAAGRLVAAAARGLASLAGRMGAIASRGVSALGSAFGRGVGVMARVASRVASAFLRGIGRIASGIPGIASNLASRFAELGRGVVRAIVDGIRSAGSAIGTAIGSFVPSPGDVISGIGDTLGIGGGRRGGTVVPRFNAGGRVPILASGGEMYVENGRASMIPGPSDRDGTLMMARPGAQIITGHGQQLMAMGASLGDAIRHQLPHFRTGTDEDGVTATASRRRRKKKIPKWYGPERITPGKYLSTSYGPPWGGIQGTGTTRTGIDLRGGPRRYIIAVDPKQISLKSKVYVQPNPFNYGGQFAAEDTGGAIKGKRIDFYDWRGRAKQNAWGKKKVTIHSTGAAARKEAKRLGVKAGTEDRTISVKRTFPRSSTRGGLLDDAFGTGVAMGQSGLGKRGRLGAGFIDQLREAQEAFTRKVTIPGRRVALGEPDRGGGSRAGGRQKDSEIVPAGRGAMARMVSFANAVDRRRFQYAWGGGHASFPRPGMGSRHAHGRGRVGLGYDCSGGVSAVLHAGGLAKHSRTSGTFMGYGRPGAGKRVSIIADSGHVIMRLGNRYWGTSGQNPGGGAGWLTGNTMRGRGVVRHPAGFRSGGIVQRFRKGGGVARASAGPKGATVGKPMTEEGTLKFVEQVWSKVAPLLNASFGVPTVKIGGLRSGTVASANQSTNTIKVGGDFPKVLGRRQTSDRDYYLNALLHEFAHMRQETMGLREREGGASWFANLRSPGVFRGMGIAYRNPPLADDPYAKHISYVQRKHTKRWALHEQFMGDRFEPQEMRRGGGVLARVRRGSSQAGRTFDSGRSSGPRFAPRIGRSIGRVMRWQGGSLEELDRVLGQAAEEHIAQLRRAVLRRIRKGGDAKTITRLQQALDIIDGQLGLRVGRAERFAERAARGNTRRAARLDRDLRTRGVDAGSSLGIAGQEATEAVNRTELTKAARRLGVAIKTAQRAGQGAKARELADRLAELNDEIAESAVRQIELMRDRVRAAAQERTEQIGYELDLAQAGAGRIDTAYRGAGLADSRQALEARASYMTGTLLGALERARDAALAKANELAAIGDKTGSRDAYREYVAAFDAVREAAADAGELMRDAFRRAGEEIVDAAQTQASYRQQELSGLDSHQRIHGYADTVAAIQQRAATVRDQVIPALTAARDAAWWQSNRLAQAGDAAGSKAAYESYRDLFYDVQGALADSADLFRDAANRLASNVVEQAQHNAEMTDLQLQRMELEQRLVGTFDTGTAQQARAQFIREQVISSIQVEISALEGQRAEANRQANTDLVRQLEQRIFGNQNRILQAQLDAQEQTAQNTEGLKDFTSSLSTEYHGETFTDSDLASAFNGT